jgi:hypothetical protein
MNSVLERFVEELPVGYASAPNPAGGVHAIPGAVSWRFNGHKRRGLF